MKMTVEGMGRVDCIVNLEEPKISSTKGINTSGSVFLERILLVVISTEPVRDRSYAIELGGR